ncbi:MAG TPA: class I SAM-dependent methyltransferase [Stellaceae bacterium]
MNTATVSAETFYNERYFRNRYRDTDADFGAAANLHYFKPFVGEAMTVVDFGCSGGWTLSKLDCAEKIGIEINPVARDFAEQNFRITAYESFEPVQGESADLVVSNHALEHTLEPARHVSEAFRVLKRGGRAVFVVPCEGVLSSYSDNDPDQHLYTWSPANLGNLFRVCGFTVIESKPFLYRFPPKPRRIQAMLGWRGFHIATRLWAYVYWRMMQVRLVAVKPH